CWWMTKEITSLVSLSSHAIATVVWQANKRCSKHGGLRLFPQPVTKNLQMAGFIFLFPPRQNKSISGVYRYITGNNHFAIIKISLNCKAGKQRHAKIGTHGGN